jgi:uncharacterized protein
LVIRVRDIIDKVRCLTAIEKVEEHPTLLSLQAEGICTFISPLALEFRSFKEYDHIRVEGLVETDVTLTCSRCLTPFSKHLRSLFTIFYTKATGAVSLDEEVELGEKELISATYEGDEINLSPEVDEHIIMELPMKPLCSGGCRGLCSSCGTDLNLMECDCAAKRGSFSFSALKNIKLER